MIKDRIRFANNLGNHVVTIDGNKVKVHCVGWNTLEIDAIEGEDVNALRDRIHELIKGTPADIASVEALIRIAL